MARYLGIATALAATGALAITPECVNSIASIRDTEN